ncbi:MAG: OmpA family protein [Myxococcales bacterium]|nr:OmpA family protein [Myxococcales bacterium]
MAPSRPAVCEETAASEPEVEAPLSQDLNSPITAEEQASCALLNVYLRDPSSLEISEAGLERLRHNAACAVESGQPLTVQAHTDQRGTMEYNLAVTERVAEMVSRRLVEFGVPESRVSTEAYGEDRLVCDSLLADCLLQNRRVEFSYEP